MCYHQSVDYNAPYLSLLLLLLGLGLRPRSYQAYGIDAIQMCCQNCLSQTIYLDRRVLQKILHWLVLSVLNLFVNISASLIPASCLIGVCLSGCDKTSVVACMIIATLFYGSMFAGVYSNHVDIGSNFAGSQYS